MKLSGSFKGVVGIFGGTFDPVHNGHLRAAYELKTQLEIDRVHFIPTAQPPHRGAPEAPAELRLKMLEAALSGEAGCVVDRREIDRDGTSYSIDTARSLRQEYPDHVLCLLLGMDAFLGLPRWHQWEQLLGLVNLVVARRPGAQLPLDGDLGRLLDDRRIQPDINSRWAAAGQIIVQDVTQLEIAATDLRSSIRAGMEPKYLVPDSVRDIIKTSRCYAG
jgi:nicotinate-nucleotide adenylyltransferase